MAKRLLTAKGLAGEAHHCDDEEGRTFDVPGIWLVEKEMEGDVAMQHLAVTM